MIAENAVVQIIYSVVFDSFNFVKCFSHKNNKILIQNSVDFIYSCCILLNAHMSIQRTVDFSDFRGWHDNQLS